MKPSPGIVPQQLQIEKLHAAEPAITPPADPAPALVDGGSSAAVNAAEKSILAKLVDALRSLKP